MALKYSFIIILAALAAQIILIIIALFDATFPFRTAIMSTFMMLALSSIGAFSMSSVDAVRKIAIGLGLASAVIFVWNYLLPTADRFFNVDPNPAVIIDDIFLLIGGISSLFYAIIFTYYFYWERRHATASKDTAISFLPASVSSMFDVDPLQGEAMDKDPDTANDIRYLDRFEERAEARNLEFSLFFSIPLIMLDAFMIMHWAGTSDSFYIWGIVIALVVWMIIVYIFWYFLVDEFAATKSRDDYASAIQNAAVAFEKLSGIDKTTEQAQFASALAAIRATSGGALDKNAKFCIGDLVKAVKTQKVGRDQLTSFARFSNDPKCGDGAIPVAQDLVASETISRLFEKVDAAQSRGRLKDLVVYRGMFIAAIIVIVAIILLF